MSPWGMLNIPAAGDLFTLIVTDRIGSSLLPLDGAGRLGTDIQHDAVATSDFVDDTTGDGAEHLIGHTGPVGGHSVDTLHDA